MDIVDDELTPTLIDTEDDPPEPDPGPDDDDDPEGDCMAFHNCSGSQWGYCILRKGHDGSHFCGKCASTF